MNEVTRIHLGRQPFVVSIEAHRELKKYLADIEKKVDDKDVVNEVELRMSELLIEKGISEDKVILPEDVDYLKAQLGDPKDFGDEDEDSKSTDETKSEATATRRLFRDTDHAMIAGVAAGLANYFGVDVVLIRLIFVVLTFFSGSGIVLYALLWLTVSPAITASERLQMQGKSVTLEALKDSVDKADLTGAARRINNSFLTFIDKLLRVGMKVIGVGFLLSGLGLLFGVVVIKVYMALHNGKIFQENLFPVGAHEQWLVNLGAFILIIVSIFLLLMGIASLRHKWPIHGWMTGILMGIFLVGSAATIALVADAAPHVQKRYESTLHTTAVKDITPFKRIDVSDGIDISYTSSPTYAVNIHYSGNPDLSKIKVSVKNDTLYVDAHELDGVQHCTMLCLFPRYNMTIQVYAPNVEDFRAPQSEMFYHDTPALPGKE